eukprot:3984888-Prymnesium_polylepis.2
MRVVGSERGGRLVMCGCQDSVRLPASFCDPRATVDRRVRVDVAGACFSSARPFDEDQYAECVLRAGARVDDVIDVVICGCPKWGLAHVWLRYGL